MHSLHSLRKRLYFYETSAFSDVLTASRSEDAVLDNISLQRTPIYVRVIHSYCPPRKPLNSYGVGYLPPGRDLAVTMVSPRTAHTF